MRVFDSYYWRHRHLKRNKAWKNANSSYPSTMGRRKTLRIQKIRSYFCKKYLRKQQFFENENHYNQQYQKLMKTLTISGSNFFGNDNNERLVIERENNWMKLSILGKPLIDYYSWAIPTSRLLKIIGQFQPLIEIGAGKGYWSYLLRKQGVTIRAFDAFPNKKHSWTLVEKGIPSTIFIHASSLQYKTLLLCYPDEASELAVECLEMFHGQYVIHIGELINTGSYARYPQSSFGRTTSSSFQLELMEKFHCIGCFSLPSFPFCNDKLTIWKRTELVVGRNHGVKLLQNQLFGKEDASSLQNENSDVSNEEDEETEDSGEEMGELEDDFEGESEESNGEVDYWASVPVDERPPSEWVCKAYEKILD
jgi:hypothetical protein